MSAQTILITPEILSVLPPVVTLLVAFWRRQIILALLIGLLLSEALQAYGLGASLFSGLLVSSWGTLLALWEVLLSASNRYVLGFSLLVGALLGLLRASGGVGALIAFLSNKGYVNTPRQAGFIPALVGIFIFIESNLSILTSGLIGQKLFDKFKLTRARLAFVIDTTCAPIAILILINGWGAFVLSQIEVYHFESAVSVLIGTIPLNLYAWFILLTLFFTLFTGKVFGPLKYSRDSLMKNDSVFVEKHENTKKRYMLMPLLVLLFATVAFMFYTGQGNFFAGSGAKSVFMAVVLAIVVLISYTVKDSVLSPKEVLFTSALGIKALLPLVSIVWLSMAIGLSIRELGTGIYITQLVGPLVPLVWIAPLLFLSACFAAFATGTSWGTFALLIPIGMPLSISLGIPPEFLLAAILSGGIWGDHCSPISDTTLISSLASGCDHLEHVRTQLPYAITVGSISFIGFWLMGYALI